MVTFKEESESRISDKHMTWSLSRNGLYAGAVLVVSVVLWQYHKKKVACEIGQTAGRRCESSKLRPGSEIQEVVLRAKK